MDNAKVDQVLTKIISMLGGIASDRMSAEGDKMCHGSSVAALRHAKGLAVDGLKLPPEKFEKKLRWLGFIQGVLWCYGEFSLDELKRMNMPDEEKDSP